MNCLQLVGLSVRARSCEVPEVRPEGASLAVHESRCFSFRLMSYVTRESFMLIDVAEKQRRCFFPVSVHVSGLRGYSDAEGVLGWRSFRRALHSEVGPPVLVAQTRDAQAIRTRFWCVPVQKAAKSPPCSLLFFHFFHFLTFFSCFLLPNTHSKHLSCWQTCRPKKLRRRTEKSVPPSLSVEAKREKPIGFHMFSGGKCCGIMFNF